MFCILQRSQITHDNADGTDIPAPDSNVKDIQSTGLSDDEPADAKQDAPASSGDEADTSTSGDEAIVRRAVEVLSRTRESDAKMCESNVSQVRVFERGNFSNCVDAFVISSHPSVPIPCVHSLVMCKPVKRRCSTQR